MDWGVSIDVMDWCGMSWSLVHWSMGINMGWSVVDLCVSNSVVDWSGMSWGVVDWCLSVCGVKMLSSDIIGILMASMVWRVTVRVGGLVVWGI